MKTTMYNVQNVHTTHDTTYSRIPSSYLSLKESFRYKKRGIQEGNGKLQWLIITTKDDAHHKNYKVESDVGEKLYY